MGLGKHYGIDIHDNHHIRKMSKLDDTFIAQYCICHREMMPPPSPPEPRVAPTEPRHETTNFDNMDPAM